MAVIFELNTQRFQLTDTYRQVNQKLGISDAAGNSAAAKLRAFGRMFSRGIEFHQPAMVPLDLVNDRLDVGKKGIRLFDCE